MSSVDQAGGVREATRSAMAEGYTCVKVNPIFFGHDGGWFDVRYTGMLENAQLRAGVDRIAAMRDAGGPDLDIIVELHALTDTNTAVQVARELEPYRILYCEEAVSPLSPVQTRAVADGTSIPLAGGERIYGRSGFRPFLENGSLRVLQPDVGNCGGLTEAKKIADMAYTYDAAVQAHVCGGPVAVATALQLQAAIPNFLIHEHHAAAALEENIALGRHDYQPKDGFVEVPDRPGIGQELSEYALRDADIVTVTEQSSLSRFPQRREPS